MAAAKAYDKKALQMELMTRGVAPDGMKDIATLHSELEKVTALRGTVGQVNGPITHGLLWMGYARPLNANTLKASRVTDAKKMKERKTQEAKERQTSRSVCVRRDVTIPDFDALFASSLGNEVIRIYNAALEYDDDNVTL